MFSIAHCTACVIVHETCAEIVQVLLKSYIGFSTGDKVNEVVDGFGGVSQCCGAIDAPIYPFQLQ